jgi:hypothetical protein
MPISNKDENCKNCKYLKEIQGDKGICGLTSNDFEFNFSDTSSCNYYEKNINKLKNNGNS